ncbi:MAG: ATP-binding protein [Dysgonamonadaceae bacterium]|jgi:predicted AAA+ superfamily ATPase|nr:ATP-binding protein [Dysgonamonadaceae bacterium]
MYFFRNISDTIIKTSDTFPVVLITGPRQVGKSTVLAQLKEDNRKLVTLDDPQIRALAQTDPALFLQTYEPPVLIDEVQYAPQLFPYIKMIVDRRKEKGLFWLTGSQPFQLMEKVSESLAGRVGILELQGLSQAEKNQTAGEPFLPDTFKSNNRKPYNINSIYNLILKGSFPELYATPKLNRNIFYASYLKTYIERDIRELTNVQDERLFLTFLKVVAARTGQLLNYADIAKDVGITENTVKAWISLLLTSGLVFLLHPYHNNLTNRAIKTPKLHFMDTGLCAYLCGWTSAETLSVGAMSGAIFESYVVGEIIKSYIHNNEQVQFYFYRDKEKQEIDLIIERDNIFYPVEIKRTAAPKEDDVKTFRLIEKMGLKAGKGSIICLYENLIPLNRDVQIVPVGYLG